MNEAMFLLSLIITIATFENERNTWVFGLFLLEVDAAYWNELLFVVAGRYWRYFWFVVRMPVHTLYRVAGSSSERAKSLSLSGGRTGRRTTERDK